MLPGREREGVFLNELLKRVRAGHSAAIMVHGEAGVGKTALLSEAFGAAPGSIISGTCPSRRRTRSGPRSA